MNRFASVRLERPEISVRIDLRALAVGIGLALAALAALIASVGLGEFAVSPPDVVRALAGLGPSSHEFIVTELRLPRALVAFCVGLALGGAGAIFQGLTRNPLASPEILGVTAGANVAAVIVVVAFPQTPLAFLSVAALAGGLLATALVYLLAWRGGTSPVRLILVGIAITTAGYAVVTAVISSVDEIVHASQLVAFTVGSVFGTGWSELSLVGPAALVLVALAVAGARHLDALRLGDEVARGLGGRLERERLILLAIGTALAASAVAVAGPVSFVGLIAPHMARRLVGPAHAVVVPVAALMGGTVVIVADALARTLFAPVEIPLGVMTAVVGAPSFLYLLLRTASRSPAL